MRHVPVTERASPARAASPLAGDAVASPVAMVRVMSAATNIAIPRRSRSLMVSLLPSRLGRMAGYEPASRRDNIHAYNGADPQLVQRTSASVAKSQDHR